MTKRCTVCDKPIPQKRQFAAESRGQEALYDTNKCRNTAAKRRARSK